MSSLTRFLKEIKDYNNKGKQKLPLMVEMPDEVISRAKYPTATAVIVTYNRLDLLKETVAAVIGQETDKLSHIFIINNHSTDETAAYLETLTDPRITVFHLPENIGGAGGFNYGIRKFMEETNDELVWVMDDDTYPSSTALAEIQKFYSAHPKVGFIASNVRWKTFDGEAALMNVMPTRGREYNDLNLPGTYAIEWIHASFVSVAFSRWIVSQIGLPQKEYFIWGDDIEYCNRAADVYPGYMLANSVVAHQTKENNEPGNIFKETDVSRLWRFKYEYRNRVVTETRIHKNLRRQLARNRHDVIRVWFRKNDPIRKEKIKVMKEGHQLAKTFNPEIEYVGEKPKNVRSRILLGDAEKAAEVSRPKLDQSPQG